MPVLPSYRSQLIDLLCKSIDWFPYEGNTGTSWVKVRRFSVTDTGYYNMKIAQLGTTETVLNLELWNVLRNKYESIGSLSMCRSKT